MDAEDALRLAWEADHDGRSRLRDALMTLAVAESRPGDGWVERCRSRLISERPDHFLAQFPTVAQALEDSRVVEARDRLRAKYPLPKLQWLLLKARAARGPYLGRPESLESMIEDLAGPMAEAENLRRDSAQASRGPIQLQRPSRPLLYALAQGSSIPTGLEMLERTPRRVASMREETISEPPIEDFSTYYSAVLLAIAFLLATVQDEAESRPTRG